MEADCCEEVVFWDGLFGRRLVLSLGILGMGLVQVARHEILKEADPHSPLNVSAGALADEERRCEESPLRVKAKQRRLRQRKTVKGGTGGVEEVVGEVWVGGMVWRWLIVVVGRMGEWSGCGVDGVRREGQMLGNCLREVWGMWVIAVDRLERLVEHC